MHLGMAVSYLIKIKTEKIGLALPFKELERVYGIHAKILKATNQKMAQV
jgi:hypothetical protein